ncbi:MAG: site-2 protease family protein [Anaerolineae bacterium]|nr:site-2 protease family protein [Anaerolineae bacterium]
MYDELSTHSVGYEVPRPTERPMRAQDQVEAIVADVLVIEKQLTRTFPPGTVVYIGRLQRDSEAAFAHLDEHLAPLDLRAQLSKEGADLQSVTILRGRFAPRTRPIWLNVVLLVLTVFSTMMAGAIVGGEIDNVDQLFSLEILRGLPYALSVLLILGAHELGHYFAARHHQVSVTLPYFIPFPPLLGFGFGTLGAFIQLREPMRNRKQLFDVGVAGPLAGLVFAVPILMIGVATAEVNTLPTEAECEAGEGPCGYILEGNSLLYATTKFIFHGDWLPNSVEDMTINQLSFAGWTGLFVTGLNLLPVGQLDGGHVLYSLLGKTARRLYLPALLLMLGLVLFVNSGWLLWLVLLTLFGRVHAVPMDDITPLDNGRRALGIFALAVFVLVFVPSPITIVNF